MSLYEWYKRFQEGREDIEDNARSGCPSTSTNDENVEKVKEIVLANRRITIREEEIVEEIGIFYGTCEAIFADVLNMKRVTAKFVLKLLNFQQKQHRVTIAEQMLVDVADNPDLFKRVITGDETWIYGYDVQMKAQSSQWKFSEESRPKKARQVRLNMKILLIVFFDYNGIVHHEFLPPGHTRSTIYKFCAICVRQFGENDPNFGEAIRGLCTTTTYRFAYPTVLSETQHCCDSATTLFSRHGPL